MERLVKTEQDVQAILATAQLVSDAAQTIAKEWKLERTSATGSAAKSALPSPALFEAQKTIHAATGKLTELVSEGPWRILEMSMQYWEARCLHVAAERRIPDIIARETGKKLGGEGVGVEQIAQATGIEPRKLSRVLRCLCSNGVFQEPRANAFANNSISASLVSNEPLRAYVLLFGLDLYTASDFLPKYLLDSKDGASYEVENTAWQRAIGTTKARWDWLEERVPLSQLDAGAGGYPGFFSKVDAEGMASMHGGALQNGKTNGATNGHHSDDEQVYTRPELEIFSLAMVGGGKVIGEAHVYDYPWASVGKGTFVDVGGGAGGFCIQLSKHYPELNFVVQDRGPVLKDAEHRIWPEQSPAALSEGRVRFVEHDFFQTNPVQGADIYWIRSILHDWSDDYCVRILKGIRESMSAGSKLLICDQIMNTTLGDPSLGVTAPAPLPANYGYFTRYSHSRDLAMMGIINGIERTPDELKSLLQQAGLRLNRIWQCRSQVSIAEAVLP